MTRKISEEILTAYVLGELKDKDRRKVEALIERSPKVRQAVAELESTVRLATEAFAETAESTLSLTPQQRSEVRERAEHAPANGLFDSNAGLFGTPSEDTVSPFETGGGIFSAAKETTASEHDDEVFSSAPRETETDNIFDTPAAAEPRVNVPKAAGERNENSVLFSLGNLKTLAEASRQPVPANIPRDEASGLIDIRRLARLSPQDASPESVAPPVYQSPGFTPVLGAPTLAAPERKSPPWTKLAVAAGIALVSATTAIVATLALRGGDDDAATQAQIEALTKQLAALTDGSENGANEEAIARLKSQLEEKRRERRGEASEDHSVKEVATVASAGEPAAASTSSARKRKASPRRSTVSAKGGSAKRAAPAKSEAEPAEPTAKPGRVVNELDDLLGADGSGAKKRSASSSSAAKSGRGNASGGGAKASLSRSDVQRGMGAVAPAVKRCGQGNGGTITMSVTIGKTGRVSNAAATGAFAGTPIGSCAARAVRRAKFPASQKTLNVKYPFKL